MAQAAGFHSLRRPQLSGANRFWPTLEWPYGPADIRCVWQKELGADFEKAARFIRPTAQTVAGFPCDEGCLRRIIDHGDGEIVAVCGDMPARCDRLRLTRADIVVYEVDLRKLCGEVAATLGLDSAPRPTSDGTWNLGTVAFGGDHAMVHLALPRSGDDFRRTVTELVSSTIGAFVLLTPLSHRTDSRTVELIGKQKAHYQVLAELLSFGIDGELIAKATLGEVVRGASDTVPETPENVFKLKGDYWELTYTGEARSLKNSKGLQYLSVLLRHPGRKFLPVEIAMEAGESMSAPPAHLSEEGVNTSTLRDFGTTIDHQTLASCRTRLYEIETEEREVKEDNDLARLEGLRVERDQVEDYLSAALGIGRRPRQGKTPAQKAHDRVTKALKRGLADIEAKHPSLAKHLQVRHTDGMWGYCPEQLPEWDL